jgi:uncharacterized membrane protein YdjX (TVP38/TMEM64 family)
MNEHPESNNSLRPRPSWVRHVPLVGILVAAIIGYWSLGDVISFEVLQQNRESLVAFRDSHFVGLAACFVGAYFLIVALSLPGASVASVTGGFLFGLSLGTVLNVMSATLGACVIFLAARLGLGRVLSSKIEASDGALKNLKNGLHKNEVSYLFLMRLVPIVPFFVANLLPALVGVKFKNFFVTTVLGIIPGGLVFSWIGVGLGEVFDRGQRPDLSLLWEPQIIGPIFGLCLLAILPLLLKKLRSKRKPQQ